ncbi:Glutathione reductase [Hibiscus syriacus]|uniref:Glutathione reductase n=1 Tax=Hibiscus syriacus TaxID=106335 RepID=A0A6A2YQZ9_HIBSY|nr:Glutathione reductase [Hibiscus syriacus]
MATSFTAPKLLPRLSSPFAEIFPFSSHTQHPFSFPRHHHRFQLQQQRRRLGFVVRAESENGSEPCGTTMTSHYRRGSGGVRASRFAANSGASVAVCFHFLLFLPRPPAALAEQPNHDWSTLMANKNAELQRLTGIYKNILGNAGVTLIEGRGKILDPHTVDVDGKLYTARHILISVGGRPFIPDIPGSEYVIDSDAALDLPSKPQKIAIVGGGYIALEFAGIFNDQGFVGEQMSLRGIKFHIEESPQAIVKSADSSLSLKTKKGTIEGFSHIMFATGRRPNTKNLGLESVGVKMNRNGAIEVDEYSRTTVPSIWAVGDVTDRINLTPVALMEGGALAKTIFQNEPTKPDYSSAVPSAVFSQPPIGQVGLTEEQDFTGYKEYGNIDVYTANFRPLKATLSGLPDRVFMKLIVCVKTNKVLGLHMCGEDSAEITQGFAVAIKAGLTKADFDATVGIHPTSAEEFVTMRTPTRKIRQGPESEGKTGLEAKAAAGV